MWTRSVSETLLQAETFIFLKSSDSSSFTVGLNIWLENRTERRSYFTAARVAPSSSSSSTSLLLIMSVFVFKMQDKCNTASLSVSPSLYCSRYSQIETQSGRGQSWKGFTFINVPQNTGVRGFWFGQFLSLSYITPVQNWSQWGTSRTVCVCMVFFFLKSRLHGGYFCLYLPAIASRKCTCHIFSKNNSVNSLLPSWWTPPVSTDALTKLLASCQDR